TGASWQDTILQLMHNSATLIYDGDDENDNVTNLYANFYRIDALAALDAVYVPEPSSIAMFASGIAGWTAFVWLRKRRCAA
ncbi:MAG TPA: PEP-CTERM sorting domain-containing protein, partial [Thermoguttaceae bacterium]